LNKIEHNILLAAPAEERKKING